jgi:hypothetical protein
MKETYKGCTITIEQDEFPESPREWSNVGTMVCWHRRSHLGDVQVSSDVGRWVADLISKLPKKDKPAGVGKMTWWHALCATHFVLPLYLYEHGSMTMNTTGFSCLWDSGQVGFIYCTKKKGLAECGSEEAARKYMVGEVEAYDTYLRGGVLQYDIESPEGDHIGSLCGIYGYDYALEQAKEEVDGWAEQQVKLGIDIAQNI